MSPFRSCFLLRAFMTYKIAPYASGMVNLEFFGPSLLWMGYMWYMLNLVYGRRLIPPFVPP